MTAPLPATHDGVHEGTQAPGEGAGAGQVSGATAPIIWRQEWASA